VIRSIVKMRALFAPERTAHVSVATEKFIKIRFSDGGYCVCVNMDDAKHMTEGLDRGDFSISEVEMTREQYEALPEFQA
jgi:hypothetical protein